MIGCEGSLATRYDVALLDLDGVVYLGEQAIAGVPEALAGARRLGMKLAFVTNNASRTPDEVADLLVRLGVPAQPADVITSSHAAAHYLADRFPAGSPILILGTTGLIDAVVERGLKPVYSAADGPVAVVQGFSPKIGWPDLAEGMVAIRSGATWVATNLDPSVPSARGPLPGNGSLVAALVHATGLSPKATGKPDPTMHAESVQRSGAAEPIVVGDRLDTDIEGAKRANCASLLVLTGVTSAPDLVAAEPLHRPDFVGADVSALLVGHPDTISTAQSVTCGAATVHIGLDRQLVVVARGPGHDIRRDGDELDWLRAQLATASWQISDAGDTPGAVSGADEYTAGLLHRAGF